MVKGNVLEPQYVHARPVSQAGDERTPLRLGSEQIVKVIATPVGGRPYPRPALFHSEADCYDDDVARVTCPIPVGCDHLYAAVGVDRLGSRDYMSIDFRSELASQDLPLLLQRVHDGMSEVSHP